MFLNLTSEQLPSCWLFFYCLMWCRLQQQRFKNLYPTVNCVWKVVSHTSYAPEAWSWVQTWLDSCVQGRPIEEIGLSMSKFQIWILHRKSYFSILGQYEPWNCFYGRLKIAVFSKKKNTSVSHILSKNAPDFNFLGKITKFRPLEIMLPKSWNFVTWDNFRCTIRNRFSFYSRMNG